MTRTWTSAHDRLLIVGGTGLLDGSRVGVAAGDVPTAGAPALLSAAEVAPVRIMPLAELPAGMVAAGEALAGRLRLAETGTQPWQLLPQPAVPAGFATIEPMTDGAFTTIAEELSRATDVAGRVLRIDPDEASWLDVGGAAMLVREVTDAHGRALSGLVEITERTELLLFSPGNRTGVDVVVLADCSGSMLADDVVTGRPRGATIKRSEALRAALERLLAARQRVAGRVARIALVKFTHQSTSVFPAAGGMAEMDADASPAVVREFRDAINKLIPESRSGTNIGQALHAAAELLHRYGVPGNDRLIVLVSDGAHLAAKDDALTGELVSATDEPVLLMDELYKAGGIRLHALGISDLRSFETWWRHRYGNRPQEVSLIPNHDLLGDLINVGGGDPTRIGGLDVLEEYFGGLGAGVSRRTGRPAPPRVPALQPELREALRRVGQIDPRTRADIDALADRVRAVYSMCAEASQRRNVGQLFRPSNRWDDLDTLGRPVSCRGDFVNWITSVYKVFHENLDSRLRRKATQPYPIEEITVLLGPDSDFASLFLLRHDEVHDRPHQETRTRAGQFFARCTGRYALDPDDAANWARVQLGALQQLHDVLVEVEGIINPATPEEPVTEPEDEPAVKVVWTVS